MVLVVDYGSQYSRLITRRIRENEVYSEVVFPDDPVDLSKVDAVVLSGGPKSVYEEGAPGLPEWFREYRGPVLAICYGMQLIVKEFGGEVKRGRGEYGRTLVELSEDPLFEGIPDRIHVWMSHGDEVVKLPEGFHPIAVS
ncbi:MAG TPA: GMP synthase (glutamine-hydrolyzing), partial [Thermotoga neapolitana]|nr:GMP synthase (glutamine-hydrolyzing) [Thermotoga neapolitana]